VLERFFVPDRGIGGRLLRLTAPHELSTFILIDVRLERRKK
jgi:hypothetical protein